ncbi:hypothetical protein BU23DRAFT_604958 [Bimuria novae-zelandiae CBS 107.79]|uniref:WD40 repeat-like protein n=1 Tax=Bimuria novae-zelandiae CBS 107.79 TaxID=1447943 RepID=A0A6A5UIM4_9PLEO|nr:hypothetical protein BU23DRAFT_604958 [Bimuria novae-zelandiae CBS 107.79]
MARNSYASFGTPPLSPEQHLHMTERFDVLRADLGTTWQTRLQQQRRRLPIRDHETFVSTAIAPNHELLAAATFSEVRLYDVGRQDRAKNARPFTSTRVKMISKTECIRAIAISNDLLAVVTRLRLIIYQYRETGDIEDHTLEDVRIDQKAGWMPRSVAILQVSSTDTLRSAAAWIAVGGEGVNGMKLYQYSQKTWWRTPHDYRLNLICPKNTGLLHAVGFSTFVRDNWFVVFAITSENRVICWKIQTYDTGCPAATARNEYDANATHSPSPHSGSITAVNVFESPHGKPYIFVAVDQKHGSHLIRSFIAPLGAPSPQWRSLPDKAAGRQLCSATATSNGRFLILAEKSYVKVLTLRAAYEGGLTCFEHTLEWPSSLRDTAKDIRAISLSAKESLGCVEVTGVDGRGHLIYARVSVPGMPETMSPSLTRCPTLSVMELPANAIVRELCGKEVGRSIRVDYAVAEGDSESEEIQIMLG